MTSAAGQHAGTTPRRRGAFYGFAEAAQLPPARRTAGKVFPELDDWWAIIDRAGIADETAIGVAAAAERNRTEFGVEAIALGCVSEDRLAEAIADEFDLTVQHQILPDELAVRDGDARAMLRRKGGPTIVRINEGAEARVLLSTSRVGELAHWIGAYPAIASRLRIVTGRRLRAALVARVADVLVDIATFDLFSRFPVHSARLVVNAWQGCVLGALAIGVPVAIAAWPTITFAAMHIVFTLFFLSCVGLRFAAFRAGRCDDAPPTLAHQATDLPVYSVLVALHKEAEIVAELVDALTRLDWPASKLDVKLVCEADDRETITAIERLPLPPFVQIVEVPGVGPRTKPKALNFALQLCRGEFVVLYDAEDRPHPRQLLEAWRHFASADPAIACLQAPLEITNGANGWIARMFAFEYGALFRGLLPWLSSRRLLLPLGGTSNHFRRAALEEVGAWDPFNVTEDADLGVRLARFGYTTQTISLPTCEESPETFRVWLPQRTRWFKGWLQTWLVHTREPVRLYREVGPRSFVVVQILFGGMVISALVHPILIVTAAMIAADLYLGKPISTFQSILLTVDVINIACGYVSFLLLGWQAMDKRERRGFWKTVACTPAYWLLMSIAAWRSVVHLYRVPHLWEKTPHGRNARREPAGRDARLQPQKA